MTNTTTIRSRKVWRILRLEARADGQAMRRAKAAARTELFDRRMEALRTEARALEGTLTGGQRAELARARAGQGTTAGFECPGIPHPHLRKGS